tara:strand:+ start:531 stop:1049 length:519 start_codon:yes stop_codon:yes gene_type:complete
MSCPLTTGFTLDCKDAIGGIKSVRFTTLAEFEALTPTYTAGVASFGAASQVFYKYELDKEESSFSDDPTPGANKGTLYYVPMVMFILSKLDVAKRNEIQLLAKNRIVAIIETREATPSYWCIGQSNGLDLSAGVGASGTAAGDLNGYTLTFTGMEADPMVSVASADLAGITN